MTNQKAKAIRLKSEGFRPGEWINKNFRNEHQDGWKEKELALQDYIFVYYSMFDVERSMLDVYLPFSLQGTSGSPPSSVGASN